MAPAHRQQTISQFSGASAPPSSTATQGRARHPPGPIRSRRFQSSRSSHRSPCPWPSRWHSHRPWASRQAVRSVIAEKTMTLPCLAPVPALPVQASTERHRRRYWPLPQSGIAGDRAGGGWPGWWVAGDEIVGGLIGAAVYVSGARSVNEWCSAVPLRKSACLIARTFHPLKGAGPPRSGPDHNQDEFQGFADTEETWATGVPGAWPSRAGQ